MWASRSSAALAGTSLETTTKILMRNIWIRLSVAVITFAIGVSVAAILFLYRQPPPSLVMAPCASPPNFELVSVPCSDPDLSALSALPVIGYCDLIASIVKRSNTIVRVKGIYSVSSENSALNDPMCPSQKTWTWIESEPYSNFSESLKAFDLDGGLKFSQGRRAQVIFLGKLYGPSNEGFGHLNDYPFMLSVMKVEEFKPIPIDAP